MRLRPISTEKLDDPQIERMRREHELAITELQRAARDMAATVANLIASGVLVASMSATASSLGSNDPVPFDTEQINTIPKLVQLSAAGRFTLGPGKYVLKAAVLSSASTNRVSVQWYHVDSTRYVGIRGFGMSPDNSTGDSPQGVAIAAADVGVRGTYELRIASITGGPDISATYSWVTVERVG